MGNQSLAEFELLVLLAAVRLGPAAAYAVPIVAEIEGRTGRSVRRANVYTTLQRLETKGYVTTRLSEPRAERGGKARRLVKVEAAGLAAVREAAAGIGAMLSGLGEVLGVNP